jgi:hypothetical protein
MKQSDLHFAAAQCCIKIEMLNKMIKSSDTYTCMFLREMKEIEIKRYAEIMDHIIAPLNIV